LVEFKGVAGGVLGVVGMAEAVHSDPLFPWAF